jgi:teichuronic acid biosynthesis glycosyltransferase TuaC
MKVLIVTAMYPTPEFPAFGSFVRTQVEALRQKGIQIELLVLQGRSRKLIYPKGVIQLRQRLRDNSIDIVHAHYGLVGMVARTQTKVPVVVTFHGDDLLGTINRRGKHTYLSQALAAAGRVLGRLVDAVVVQSQQMASRLHGSNVYVIPHEVDLHTFSPLDQDTARLALNLEPQKKYLLFAANPQIPVKRFPLAKAVVEHLRKLDPAVELLVVHRETQERLALYLNACDALVFPSHQEGSPNVVKQAMACNLPIAATDVGDVREIIANTAGCHICRPSIEDFTERLSEILHFRKRTNGREHVRHLDRHIVAQQVIHVYEQTLRKKQSGAGRVNAADRLKPGSAACVE